MFDYFQRIFSFSVVVNRTKKLPKFRSQVLLTLPIMSQVSDGGRYITFYVIIKFLSKIFFDLDYPVKIYRHHMMTDLTKMTGWWLHLHYSLEM